MNAPVSDWIARPPFNAPESLNVPENTMAENDAPLFQLKRPQLCHSPGMGLDYPVKTTDACQARPCLITQHK